MGQFELCLMQVDESLKQNPQNQNLLKLKADALFYLNRIDESESIYQILLSGSPNDGDLMADYGHCLLQLERYNDADVWLSKSIKSKNSTPAYAYLGRGIARYNMGKIGVACADWERSLLLGEKSATKWLETHCQENPTTNK
jgi:Tfp pilus assembly protein PilF